MSLLIKEGDGIKLIPKGNPNEIEIIVVQRRSWFWRAVASVIKMLAFLVAAIVTGAVEAISKLLF